MIDMISKKLMRRYQLKKGIKHHVNKVCPWIMENIEKAGEETSHYILTYAKEGYFKVECHLKHFMLFL